MVKKTLDSSVVNCWGYKLNVSWHWRRNGQRSLGFKTVHLSQPFIVALIDRFFVAIFCPLIDPNHYCIYMMLFNSVPIATPSYLYIHVANSIQFCASLYIHIANSTQLLVYTCICIPLT